MDIDGKKVMTLGSTLEKASLMMGTTVEEIIGRYTQSGGAICPPAPPCVVKFGEHLVWWKVDTEPKEVIYYSKGLSEKTHYCMIKSVDVQPPICCDETDLFKVDVIVGNVLLKKEKGQPEQKQVWYNVSDITFVPIQQNLLNLSILAKQAGHQTEKSIWSKTYSRESLHNIDILKDLEKDEILKLLSEQHLKV